MALGRFLAFLLVSYVGFALIVAFCAVAAFALGVFLWGLAEWAASPYWEILSRQLR
jgi:dolichol kinase